MGGSHKRLVGALLLAAAIVAGAGHAAGASATDVLAGHGNFEKPVVSGMGKTFASGAVIDGWKVQANKVSLVRPVVGVIVPPQGKQALTLDDAFATPAQSLKPGSICRSVPTVAKHRYNASLKAGIGNSGTAQVVVKLGTASEAVALPAGHLPVVFKPYKVTLTAATANAQLCITTAKLGPKAFPVIDALTLTDLGV